MKNIDEWFQEYSKDHQNPLNQKIHYICVPAILYSVLGLLWLIHLGFIANLPVNAADVMIVLTSLFYLKLDIKLGMIMLAITSFFCVSFAYIASSGLSLLWLCISVFVFAWIGQFYGHKVEGQKPSFLTDVVYLLIGPLWVLKKALK